MLYPKLKSTLGLIALLAIADASAEQPVDPAHPRRRPLIGTPADPYAGGPRPGSPAARAAADVPRFEIRRAEAAPRLVFTRNLTLGSRGADVVALQTYLEAKGFMVMPAGVPKGYFGPLLRAALAKFQQVRGIHPHSGYFGPITRAAFNAGYADSP